MEDWDKEVTYSLDVEMIEGILDGRRQNLAGRVVLVRSDPFVEWIKVMDAYIKYPDGVVLDCMTRYSRIEPWQLQLYGIPRDCVVNFLLSNLLGCTLVTFSGRHDFASLGISEEAIMNYVRRHVELQTFFKRADGTPYALGPLVDYFGYSRNNRKVIIRHNCLDDAVYTLRLYRDYYQEDFPFAPVSYIMSKKEYCNKYGIC